MTTKATNRPAKGQKLKFTTPREAVKFAVEDREGKLPKLTGYAMTWGQLSDDRGGYKVRLMPNSAKPADGNVFALCDHDYSRVLASTGNGTLTMSSDAYGLKVEIDPADTTYARDLIALIRRGDVAGMSFGMLWDGATWQVNGQDNGCDILEYSTFIFDEVTVTAIPAFTSTTIASEFSAKPPEAPKPAATPLRNKVSVELEEMLLAIPKE